MEKDTVLLSLYDYNKLKDDNRELNKFKKKVLDDKVVVFEDKGYMFVGKYYFYTKSKAIKKAHQLNKKINKDKDALIKDYEKEIVSLKITSKKEIDLYDVKKMSIFEFIKWRKK